MVQLFSWSTDRDSSRYYEVISFIPTMQFLLYSWNFRMFSVKIRFFFPFLDIPICWIWNLFFYCMIYSVSDFLLFLKFCGYSSSKIRFLSIFRNTHLLDIGFDFFYYKNVVQIDSKLEVDIYFCLIDCMVSRDFWVIFRWWPFQLSHHHLSV